jgi:hypothetical protein
MVYQAICFYPDKACVVQTHFRGSGFGTKKLKLFQFRNKQAKLVPDWEPKIPFGTGALLPTDQQVH